MKKHFVTFYSPGTLFSETDSVEIDSWDIKKAVEMSKTISQRYGAKPYAFKFSTRLFSPSITVEGHEMTVEPKTIEESNLYYITGTVRTGEEVLSGTDPDEDILRSNVRANKFPAVIENRNSYRSTLPFYETDVVVDWDGNLTHKGSEYCGQPGSLCGL